MENPTIQANFNSNQKRLKKANPKTKASINFDHQTTKTKDSTSPNKASSIPTCPQPNPAKPHLKQTKQETIKGIRVKDG